MQSILKEIVTYTRQELRQKKQQAPLATLQAQPHYTRTCLSMRQALQQSPTGIIAEFKRRSPSAGHINSRAEVRHVTAGYEKAGAAALSVLTNTEHFGGSLHDLENARATVQLPILRKDFIIEPYQLHQAKAFGADAVLLIAAILDTQTIERLIQQAHELGLEVLLELHDESENDRFSAQADMVGINNRNLNTFSTNIAHAAQIKAQLPANAFYIAESGIASPYDWQQLHADGFQGFLMGTRFMQESSPAQACQLFIEKVQQLKDPKQPQES